MMDQRPRDSAVSMAGEREEVFQHAHAVDTGPGRKKRHGLIVEPGHEEVDPVRREAPDGLDLPGEFFGEDGRSPSRVDLDVIGSNQAIEPTPMTSTSTPNSPIT